MKYLKDLNLQELRELERRLSDMCNGEVTVIPSDTSHPIKVICPKDKLTRDQVWSVIQKYTNEL